MPSLAQLDEAVRALLSEHHYDVVTVVVDATFGHRIDPSESNLFEEAVTNSELITPPAGAIGRGDAFILQIAERAGADVFSNDSFQEFHGQHPWLFDEGRLIGGKPVPNIGWVFVLRAPVRGPLSRRSVRDAKKAAPVKKAAPTVEAAVAAAEEGAPAKRSRRSRKAAAPAPAPAPEPVAAEAPAGGGEGRRRRRRSNGGGGGGGGSGAAEPLNEQLTYAAFVIDHPIGTDVEGIVERFSSHGAYVLVGDAQCYVPLRELGDPPPRSAREVLNLGDTRLFTVLRFDPERRGIDVVPAAADAKADGGIPAAPAVASATDTSKQASDAEEAPVSPAAKKASAKKASAKKAPARKAAAKKAAAKKATAKKATAKRAPAKKAAAKKATARKATAKRAPARKAAAKKSAAKKAPAKKRSAAKKATARKATAKKR